MIHQLRDMVSGPGVQSQSPSGRWVRAVPLPFYGGLFDRLRDAWAVVRGDAYAVRWPQAGELEAAMADASPVKEERSMSNNYYGQPLEVTVKNGRLIISIGVNTLAHAVSYADWANSYDDEKGDYFRTFAVSDPEAFAKDVKMAMEDEREDGSSLLSDFLDKASGAAVDDGAQGCEFDQQIKTGQFAACETWALEPDASPKEPR